MFMWLNTVILARQLYAQFAGPRGEQRVPDPACWFAFTCFMLSPLTVRPKCGGGDPRSRVSRSERQASGGNGTHRTTDPQPTARAAHCGTQLLPRPSTPAHGRLNLNGGGWRARALDALRAGQHLLHRGPALFVRCVRRSRLGSLRAHLRLLHRRLRHRFAVRLLPAPTSSP